MVGGLAMATDVLLDPLSSREDQIPSMAPHDHFRDVLLQAESAVSESIFASHPGWAGPRVEQADTPADALRAAAAVAREGKRASVALAPSELLGALEALHGVARGRAPVVVHVIEEGPAGDGAAVLGRDEIPPALEVGAGVLVAWSAQDSVDLSLAARRAAEDSETPFVVFADADGPVMSLPGSGLIEKFLGASPGVKASEGGNRAVAVDAHEVEKKRVERGYAGRVPFALGAALRDLGELTGRAVPAIERYETADAELVVVAVGGAYPAARRVAERKRGEGKKVGAAGVRSLRPFFAAEALKAVGRARGVAVLEPLDVALSPCGPLAQSFKAAFADALTWAPGFPGVGRIPPIVSVVFATLGGAVGEAEVEQALEELGTGDRARRLVVFGADA